MKIYEEVESAHLVRVPGFFGDYARLALIYARDVGDEHQTCLIAPSNVMEAANNDYWTAWPEGDYSLHYVDKDRFEAARVILDMTYGKIGEE